MEERRKYKRYNMEHKVVYSTAEEPYAEMRATGIDISLGGIGMRIEQVIKGSGNLKLLIYPNSGKDPITAEGKLVWQDKDAGHNGPLRAGIQFTGIPYTELKTFLADKINETLSRRILQYS